MPKAKKKVADKPADYEARRAKWAASFPDYAAECLPIIDRDDPTGAAVKPLVFNDCQNALWSLVERIMAFNLKRSRMLHEIDARVPISPYPIKIVVLKARKVGISTMIGAYAAWRSEFNRATKCMIMAHHLRTAVELGSILRNFPNWRSPDLAAYHVPIVRSPDQKIAWESEHGSVVEIETAGTRVQGANRGRTYHVLHISEEAFITDPSEVSAALAAQTSYSVVFEESTANGPGDLFHENWEGAWTIEEAEAAYEAGAPDKEGWNGSFQFFWPWFADQGRWLPLMPGDAERIMATLSEEERELVDLYQVKPEQLKWRRHVLDGEAKKNIDLSPIEYFHQEYPATPEQAFVAKGRTVFNQDRLVKMAEGAHNITPSYYRMIRVEEDSWEWMPAGREEATLKVYEPPAAGHSYVIGMDAAEGGDGSDPSVLTVFDRTDGTFLEEVARFRGRLLPDELGELMVLLAHHYNEAFIVPDRNPQGKAACIKIARMGYAYTYHSKNVEVVSDQNEPDAFTVGYLTSNTTRPILIAKGALALHDGFVLLRDSVAIKEWQSFQYIEGKPQAPLGKHDDCVFADLLAIYAHFDPMSGAPFLDVVRAERAVDEGRVEQISEGKLLGASIREMKAAWAKKHARAAAVEATKKRLRYGNPFD